MSLTIYRSSAGSGKTYTLAREYLSLALKSPEYYQKILAVTFTNRAAEEMKERVLAFLIGISKGDHELIPVYAKELGKSEEQVVTAGKEALTHLLHHYRYFNITTIDTFFHRIIRSFSREIGLQGSFGIELDSDKVASFISNHVYEGVEKNQELRDWLVDFSLSGLREGKGYETRSQVMELAKQLFSEDFKRLPQGQFTDDAIKQKMADLKQNLYAKKAAFEATLNKIAVRFYDVLQGASLTVDDLYYKASGPAGFFQKLKNKKYEEPGIRLLNALEDPAKWSSNKNSLSDQITQLAEEQLNPLVSEALDFIRDNKVEYYTADAVLKHLYTLGLMTDLAQRLQAYKQEEEMIMISDLPDFLSQIIDDSGSPFIYEKVGSWYDHFLIDEFQDTSRFQWRNFKPLLEESISTGSKSIIVGDAKQSIYGWRGGDPTLLLETVENDLPATIDPTKNTNYRSLQNIVEFNNRLFGRLPDLMVEEMGELISDREAELIRKTYDKVEQKVAPGKVGTSGKVEVSFFKSEEGSWKQTAMKRMVDRIEDLIAQGYRMSDIAILVRGNKDAADIVNFVLDYRSAHQTKLEVISAEGMLLVNSSVVQLLLSAFRQLIDPEDTSVSADLAYRYQKSVKKKDFVNHADFASLGPAKLPQAFTAYQQHLLHLPILELVEVLIRTFALNTLSEEYVYLQAFQDAVLEFSKNNRTDLRLFMQWWDEVGVKRSVQMTGAVDAVEVITTHKSKGLQYPMVFIPFCNFDMDAKSKPVWLKSPYGDQQNLPVDYKKALGETHFSASYQQLVAKEHLESLNILYVAFTRAESGLFVFCETPSNQDKTYAKASKLLYTYFQKIKVTEWDENLEMYRLGDLPSQKGHTSEATVKLEHYISNKWSGKLKIRKTGNAYFDDEVEKSRHEGILLHQIFSEIIHWQDTAEVLAKYENAMLITAADRQEYARLIDRLWGVSQVKGWFDGRGEVKTEVVVLPKDGEVKRLDRVVIKDQVATVIDFKSGTPKARDNKQLSTYTALLREMGYDTEGYLLYLYSAEVVKIE